MTGGILFWYDRTYRQATLPSAPLSVPAAAAATPAATIDPDAKISVEIVSVIGMGILEAEMVLVHYTGEQELNLAGWHLEDEDKYVFAFPQLTLYPDGRGASAYNRRTKYRRRFILGIAPIRLGIGRKSQPC